VKKLFIASILLFNYGCNSTTTSTPASSISVEKISFSQVKKVFDQRCINCHSNSNSSGNLSMENTNQIRDRLQKINNRVVIQKTMPPSNSTNMKQEERDLVKSWIDSGASFE